VPVQHMRSPAPCATPLPIAGALAVDPVAQFTPTVGLQGGLDPDEYNSTLPAGRRHVAGEKHAQYLAAATSGLWGRAASRCGQSVLLKQQDGLTWVHPVLCDAWSCRLCGPRRAAWLIRQIKQAQMGWGLDCFVTLTVRTGSCSPAESQRLIKVWWNALNVWIKRHYGPYAYIWTMELTQAGYAHLHILLSVRLERQELKAAWSRITGGSYIVDVESSSSNRAATYLAKYCSQEAVSGRRLPGTRFFGKSRCIQFEPFRGEPDPEEEPATVYFRPFWGVVEALAARGEHPAIVRTRGTPYAAYRMPFAMVEAEWTPAMKGGP